MEGKRLPLSVVSNEQKVSQSKHRYSTRSSASSSESCADCKAYCHKIETLQDALAEVLDQNTALKTRVIELEALVNHANDEIDLEHRRKSEEIKAKKLTSKLL
mmetsp:Transcript_15319/g.27865  ORF Transcript_15319/g.27865 Transcript_15319/m.27865 type:complete len:103 (+) Transcript_15319:1106-1414(+)